MTEREAITRAIAYLRFAERWRIGAIRDYTGEPIKDIMQLAYEGQAHILNDIAKQQAREMCGRQLKW